MITPPHYDKAVTPWDLERCMESSGDAFVDSRRTDAIEYCFRIKGDLLGDLRKAAHCIQVAIDRIETRQNKTASPSKNHETYQPWNPTQIIQGARLEGIGICSTCHEAILECACDGFQPKQ